MALLMQTESDSGSTEDTSRIGLTFRLKTCFFIGKVHITKLENYITSGLAKRGVLPSPLIDGRINIAKEGSCSNTEFC